MAEYIAELLCGVVFFALSVKVRCLRSASVSARQVEGKESPLSRALQETVGYAGGIYITLVMLASFLQIDVPEKVSFSGKISVEPLAFLAVVLTVMQPFLLIAWDHLVKKK